MRIKLNSVLVDDQEKALKFYTEVVGFVKKNDIPFGEFLPLDFARGFQLADGRLAGRVERCGGGSGTVGVSPRQGLSKSALRGGHPLDRFSSG